MKQVVQDIRSGETKLIEIPVPDVQPRMALVHNHASLVSAGTERALVEFASKSLAGKAASRPDLVRQVIDKARREGLLTTVDAVKNRLDQPLPLGYSSAGTIIALGGDMQGYQVGDRVACAGGGYAVHAEYVLVPRNLLTILPKTVDFKAGAFATMGAIALHGFRLGEVGVRDRVAVVGMGLLGLLTASIAHAAGCAVMGIDVDPERVEALIWFRSAPIHQRMIQSNWPGYWRAIVASSSRPGWWGHTCPASCIMRRSYDSISRAPTAPDDMIRTMSNPERITPMVTSVGLRDVTCKPSSNWLKLARSMYQLSSHMNSP
jgi:threonine dehydrogenase-like Zn-dependent dehydrogenase